MARLRVIILDQHAEDTNTYNVVLWADVPSARQSFYVKPATFVSAWPGAQTTDNTALQNGSVSELVQSVRMATGATAIALEQACQTAWSNYQAFITGYNPWSRYNSTWDGTTWTLTNNL